MPESSRIFYCVLCKEQCVICSCCDRGQIYCSKTCSNSARRSSCLAAGERYQKTHYGRLKHAMRQSRYRQRKREETKKVTHQGSPPSKDCDLLSSELNEANKRTDYCHFCGKAVNGFLRRCFLGASRRTNILQAAIWTRAP